MRTQILEKGRDVAIVDEAGRHETLTTGERALDLFTDRVSLIRHFAKRLNEDPASNKILFFESASGNGKSLLLRYLERYYCKWLEPDNWNWVAGKPDAEFNGPSRRRQSRGSN
jgi:hypothetical protein